MSLQSLFDKGREEAVRRAICRGGPLPFQTKARELAEGARRDDQADNPLNREIRGFTNGILDDTDSTTGERLERGRAFLQAKAIELINTHGKDVCEQAWLSVNKKGQPQGGPAIPCSTLEETMKEMLRLRRTIDMLERNYEGEEAMKLALRAFGKP